MEKVWKRQCPLPSCSAALGAAFFKLFKEYHKLWSNDSWWSAHLQSFGWLLLCMTAFHASPVPCWERHDAFPSAHTPAGELASPLGIPLPVGAVSERQYQYLQPVWALVLFCLSLWPWFEAPEASPCARPCRNTRTNSNPKPVQLYEFNANQTDQNITYSVPILCRSLIIASLFLYTIEGEALQCKEISLLLLSKVTLHPCNADTYKCLPTSKIPWKVPEARGGKH